MIRILLVAILTLHAVQSRSISLQKSINPSDEQNGQLDSVLKREKKSTVENPLRFNQEVMSLPTLPPTLMDEHKLLPKTHINLSIDPIQPVSGIYPAQPEYVNVNHGQTGANTHPQFYAHPQTGPAPLPPVLPPALPPQHYQQQTGPVPLPPVLPPALPPQHYQHQHHYQQQQPHHHEHYNYRPHHHHHHHAKWNHKKFNLVSSTYPEYLRPQLFENAPESSQPPTVMDKLRTFIDGVGGAGENIESNEQHRFRSAYSMNSPPYSMPQYPNQYEVKTPTRPEYFPPASTYAAQYQPKSSCGSNLLIGCQPHVQEVPCYQSQPQPQPQPQPQLYGAPFVSNYDYKQPSAPTYHAHHFNIPPADVYSKPGPPYPYLETSVSSARSSSNSQDQIQFGNESSEKTFNSKLREDSNPESSNIEKKTDKSAQELVGESITERYQEVMAEKMAEQTTEVQTTTSTTTTTTTTPAPVLDPSTHEQIRKFHDRIENHVENLKKFKDVAGKKLRDAIEKSNSRSAADDLDDYDSFMGSPSFAKRQSVKSVDRDLYNSI